MKPCAGLRPRDAQGPRRRPRRDRLPRCAGARVSAHRGGGQALQGCYGRARSALVHRRAARGRPRALRLARGFTKEARYEADRANVPVRLLDLDSFVRHCVEVYDRADDETRSILPLTRIW